MQQSWVSCFTDWVGCTGFAWSSTTENSCYHASTFFCSKGLTFSDNILQFWIIPSSFWEDDQVHLWDNKWVKGKHVKCCFYTGEKEIQNKHKTPTIFWDSIWTETVWCSGTQTQPTPSIIKLSLPLSPTVLYQRSTITRKLCPSKNIHFKHMKECMLIPLTLDHFTGINSKFNNLF